VNLFPRWSLFLDDEMTMTILAATYFLLFAALAYRSDKLAMALLVFLLPTYGLRFSIWGVPSTFLEVAILF